MLDPNVPVPEDVPVTDGSTVLPDLKQRSRRAVVTYLVAVVVLGTPLVWWFGRLNPEEGRSLLVLFMWVPAVGAVVARVITGVRITFGTPSGRTLTAALVPALLVAVAYFLALAPAWLTFRAPPDPAGLVVTSGGSVVVSCVLAFGEEVGWRGYLLPQLRVRHGFLTANAIVLVVWIVYHVPIILLPGYYSNPDIPIWASLLLFSCTISGYSFYIGAVWERHHDVWAPTFAHGVWNYAVQALWPLVFLASSPWLMGEFGVVPAVTMAVLGIAATVLTVHRFRAAGAGSRAVSTHSP